MSDSARWHHFGFRDDDIVITTPSKCGTTWLQTIVGSLVFGRPDFGPVSEISLWYDMLVRPEEDTASFFENQTHRRFLKTHVPLDGLPQVPGVTYLAALRHPLDVALSNFDHRANMDRRRVVGLRQSASEELIMPAAADTPPDDPAEYLRWWIDNELEPNGSGPLGLADLCHQALTYWEAKDDPSVHLFHYNDLWNDLDGQMRLIAAALHIDIDEAGFADLVDAATLDSMRSRAEDTAPEAHLGLWKSTKQFFAQGGTRNWADLLTPEDLAHFDRRMDELAGDAKSWILGREAA